MLKFSTQRGWHSSLSLVEEMFYEMYQFLHYHPSQRYANANNKKILSSRSKREDKCYQAHFKILKQTISKRITMSPLTRWVMVHIPALHGQSRTIMRVGMSLTLS